MLSLVGMGPGHPKCVTQEAIDEIRCADVVLAFGRIAETAEQFRTPVARIRRVDEVCSRLDAARHVALLASGDPGFFGILDYLCAQNIRIDRVIPGISTMQYFMAALRKSWHSARFISLHGREEDWSDAAACPLFVVLTDRTHTPTLISKRLHRLGLRGDLTVGSRLSYADERVIAARISDEIDDDGSLALVVVEQSIVERTFLSVHGEEKSSFAREAYSSLHANAFLKVFEFVI